MLIALDQLTIVNTDDIVKVQAVVSKTHGWLWLRNQDKCIRISMETFWSIYNVAKKQSKPYHEPELDGNSPHVAIKDGIDTCLCGKLLNDDIHTKE